MARLFFVCTSTALLAILIGCNRPAKDRPVASPAINAPSADGHASPAIDSSFVDDALCADCHQEIYQSFQHVAMAKSFYNFDPDTAVESFDNNHFYHPPSNNHYRMDLTDGKMVMTRWRVREDGTRINQFSRTVEYVVGSGNHVRTYLYRNESGELRQLPVVWYSQESKWGMAPGYDRPDHQDFDRPITRQCMFCHNAYPELDDGADRFGMPHVFPKQMPQGIGCQRCHGPGSEHVRISSELDSDSAENLEQVRQSIVNSARLSPQRQDDVCNQCHFQPMSQRTSFVRRFGEGDFEYRPGQSLSDHMVYFEPDRNNDLADHFEINHHAYRLYQSRCFTETDGGFRCTLCHDPHAKIPEAARVQHYRSKCLSCHAPDDCLDFEHGRQPDAHCVSCHMPERRTTDVVEVTMTDHRIARRSRLAHPTASLKEIDVPIDMPIRQYRFGSQNLPDDKAEAYQLFARALDDDRSAEVPLGNLVQSSANVPEELAMQLAQLQLENRQYKLAQQSLAAVDSGDRQLPLIQTNRGVALIGTKEIEAAIDQLVSASSMHPQYAPAWYNLGVAQHRGGLDQEAIKSFETAIRLRPGYAKALNKLGSILATNDQLSAARIHFEQAIQANANDLDSLRKLSAVLRRQQLLPEAIKRIEDGLRVSRDDIRLLKEYVLLLLDIENDSARDPERALEAVDRLAKLDQGMESTILKTMAMIDSGNTQAALVFVSENMQGDERKVEAGLLIAACQMILGSESAARQNFDGAQDATKRIRSDRITRTVLAYTSRYFSAQDPEEEKHE